MTIDHVAWWLFPGYPGRRCPGHAHHRAAHLPHHVLLRGRGLPLHPAMSANTRRAMFLFALVSHFAYIFASADFSGWRSFLPFSSGSVLNQTSVMWSLAWGLGDAPGGAQQKSSPRRAGAADPADLRRQLPQRLELHRRAVYPGASARTAATLERKWPG